MKAKKTQEENSSRISTMNSNSRLTHALAKKITNVINISRRKKTDYYRIGGGSAYTAIRHMAEPLATGLRKRRKSQEKKTQQ